MLACNKWSRPKFIGDDGNAEYFIKSYEKSW
jgi:hypothetical protein